MESYSQQAFAVTHGLNVYEHTTRYPYPPVWIWIVGAIAGLAPMLGLPFHVAIKIPAALADLAIVTLLFEYVRARRGWVLWTLGPAALYALNPVPALISAAHGQFDSLPVLFTLLAFHLHDRGHRGSLEAAALALGLAIALKGYPALLLPFFALTAPAGRKVWTFGLALVPIGLAFAIYAIAAGFDPEMLTRVIGYTSTPAMGWTLFAPDFNLPLAIRAVAWLGSDLLILVFATLVPWLVFGRERVLGAAATFAFFYLVAFRSSVQYLLWGLPFFCLVTGAGALAYSLAATAMLLAYYAVSDPLALPGNLGAAMAAAMQALYQACVAAVIAAGGLLLALTLFKNRDANRVPASTSAAAAPTAA
jgi:hypothetical protein